MCVFAYRSGYGQRGFTFSRPSLLKADRRQLVVRLEGAEEIRLSAAIENQASKGWDARDSDAVIDTTSN
jgi:hypothetical protein